MNLPYHFKSIDFEGHIQENLNSYHKLKYLVTDPLPSCISGLLRKTFIDLIFQHSALRSRHCRSTCALPETEHEFIFSISVVTIAYTRDMAAGMGEYTHFSLQWHDILVFNIVSVLLSRVSSFYFSRNNRPSLGFYNWRLVLIETSILSPGWSGYHPHHHHHHHSSAPTSFWQPGVSPAHQHQAGAASNTFYNTRWAPGLNNKQSHY